MTNKEKYTGIIPPLVTPLDSGGRLDKNAAGKLLEHCVKGGVAGVFIGGTSGEAMRIDYSVLEQFMSIAMPRSGEHFHLFCGAIDATTAGAAQKLERIENAGGRLAVCTAPFYIPAFSQDEILRHFDTLCNRSKIDIAVYNIPEMTQVNILPETLAKLADYDNIIAIKDSTADWQHLQRVLFALENKNVSLFNGAEELCAVAMLFGLQGCIPGLGGFVPELFVSLYKACKRGRLNEAVEMQRRINAIRKCLFAGPAWISVMKYLLEVYGLGCDAISEPLSTLTSEQKQQVRLLLEREGALPAST